MAEPQTTPRHIPDILGGNINTDPSQLLRDQEAPVVDEPITDEPPVSTEPTAEELEQIQSEQAEARDAGWVPLEEWNGDPKKWRNASDYLAVRDHILPIVQKELRQTRDELKALRLERQQEAAAREQRNQEIERASLRMELKNARENQDWDKVDEITDKMFDLKLKQPAPAPANNSPSPEMKEAFSRIAAQNKWLAPGAAQDKQLVREWSRELDTIYKAVGTYDDHEDAMRQATNRVRRLYPEKFRTRPAGGFGDSSGEPGNVGPRGSSWNDLLPQARKDFQDMIDNSVGNDGKPLLTREGILKQCGPESFQARR